MTVEVGHAGTAPKQTVLPHDHQSNALLSQIVTMMAAHDSKLDRLLARMDAIDERIARIEPETADASALASLTALTLRIEAMSGVAGTDIVGTASAGFGSANLSTPTASNEASSDSLAALNSLAVRLEVLAASSAPASANPSLAIPNNSQFESIARTIDAISDRMNVLQENVSSLDARTAAPQAKDTLVLEKLSDLESQMNSLPSMYMDSFTTSLQKHTSSLLTTFEQVIKEQGETLSAAALAATDMASSTSTSLKRSRMSMSLPSLPIVPDMGIAKRWSKLTGGMSLSRPLTPTSTTVNASSASTTANVSDELVIASVESPNVPFEVYALYPFKAEYEDELEMDAGDVVTVNATSGRNGDVSHNGWWHAKAADGKDGWIPSNYVKP
ncbi:hypothetical protein CcCBS67573_g03995 [Chytriomyces confervae]|uniref:SH3 domain-containing protein n=1 Tax=Chytriomyces confervae TaxID=246404 RepID=A0A507FI30_9FUNG|nr:hypothetical protein HDU80_009619 [Chytriomyces hyalinus]TPX74727.1 hypothetical protein CcCBS67573_g03995 [Chytriomyces confervae]